MTKFSEEIIGKIKTERIAPVARWHFLVKGYAFWTMFALSVLFGSLSFSVMMHIATAGDWDVFTHLKGNWFTSAVMLLPYFWVLFLFLFAIIAYFNWKNTKLGYRFKRRWIVLGSVGVSIFLGNVFYALGMGKEMDLLMTKSMPFYDKSKHESRKELWLKPENGFLGGKVVSINEDLEELVVQDENGNNWTVNDRDVTWENRKLEQKGKIIKVIGKKEGEHKFSAKEIRRCGDCQADEDDEKKSEEENNKQGNNRGERSSESKESER